MKTITYKDFYEAVQFFGLIGLENKAKIKEKYIKLSKQYHPDMQNGDNEKFQELNKHYKTLLFYIDNFKFTFSKEEFQTQYPIEKSKDGKWSLW